MSERRGRVQEGALSAERTPTRLPAQPEAVPLDGDEQVVLRLTRAEARALVGWSSVERPERLNLRGEVVQMGNALSKIRAALDTESRP